MTKISHQLQTKFFKAEMESVTGENLMSCRLDYRVIIFVKLRSLLFEDPMPLGSDSNKMTVPYGPSHYAYFLAPFSLDTWSSGTFPVI